MYFLITSSGPQIGQILGQYIKKIIVKISKENSDIFMEKISSFRPISKNKTSITQNIMMIFEKKNGLKVTSVISITSQNCIILSTG